MMDEEELRLYEEAIDRNGTLSGDDVREIIAAVRAQREVLALCHDAIQELLGAADAWTDDWSQLPDLLNDPRWADLKGRIDAALRQSEQENADLRTAVRHAIKTADSWMRCLDEFADEPGGVQTCSEDADAHDAALAALAKLIGYERL